MECEGKERIESVSEIVGVERKGGGEERLQRSKPEEESSTSTRIKEGEGAMDYRAIGIHCGNDDDYFILESICRT
eukprot:751859-Hanusia_phi.AAC.1